MKKVFLLFCVIICIAVSNVRADNNSPNTATQLTETDRQQVQNLISYINNLSPTVKKEIREYRKFYQELLEESQLLYETLSKEAKEALKEEKTRKSQLTPAAKKELKKYLKELNE